MLTLWDIAERETKTLPQQAEDWMATNPDAMRLFESFALQMASTGRKFGMKLLAERVRWECQIAQGEHDYKINNNYVAYIGRELIRRHPHLAELIETRKAGRT